MTRTVRDTALLLDVMAGHDSRDPVSLRQPVPDFLAALDGGVNGMRIGYTSDLGYAAVDSEVRRITEEFDTADPKDAKTLQKSRKRAPVGRGECQGGRIPP